MSCQPDLLHDGFTLEAAGKRIKATPGGLLRTRAFRPSAKALCGLIVEPAPCVVVPHDKSVKPIEGLNLCGFWYADPASALMPLAAGKEYAESSFLLPYDSGSLSRHDPSQFPVGGFWAVRRKAIRVTRDSRVFLKRDLSTISDDGELSDREEANVLDMLAACLRAKYGDSIIDELTKPRSQQTERIAATLNVSAKTLKQYVHRMKD